MPLLTATRTWARRIKRDGLTLWFASKHSGTPWPAKALGLFVVAYALSPVDLIPDFIPVLGYLDDAILLPVLIWITVRMLPPDVLQECRAQADEWVAQQKARPASRWSIALVAAVWLLVAYLLWRWVQPWLG